MMAKRLKNHNLDEIRAQFHKLQNVANKRAEQLEEKGLDSYSKAYQAAVSKIGAYRERNFNDLFDVYDTKRYREIKREVARIKKFLNDETSTVEGVEKFIAAEKYKGAFSGDWYKTYGVSYDKSRVDEEKAKIAFSMYRRLEENNTSYEEIVGRLGYGSENLIMRIYDMVVESGIENDDSIEYWAEYGDIMDRLKDSLNLSYERKFKEANDIMADGDMDTERIMDTFEGSATSAIYWSKFNF